MPKPVTTKMKIYSAALEAFAEYGYEGASLREIANRVGIEVGSVYNHINSKEDLLFELIKTASEDLLAQFSAIIESCPDPLERLKKLVHLTASYHATHGRQSFVGYGELRALTASHRKQAVGWRSEMENMIRDCLADTCTSQYSSDEADLKVFTNLIIGMATSPSTWFSPDGPRSANEVGNLAVAIVSAFIEDR